MMYLAVQTADEKSRWMEAFRKGGCEYFVLMEKVDCSVYMFVSFRHHGIALMLDCNYTLVHYTHHI